MRVGTVEHEWLVALDDTSRSCGALRVANWLSASGWRGRWGIRGVHVVHRSPDKAALAPGHASRRVRDHLVAQITEACAVNSLEGIEFVEASDSRAGLCELAASDSVDGLIVGRAPRTDQDAVVRLGRTLRHLLQHCTVPLIVADPALDLQLLERGPIIVGVDLTDWCTNAAHWARRLASLLHRPLQLVHVVEVPNLVAFELGGRSAILYERVCQTFQRREEALRAWQAEHALEHVPAEAVLGKSAASQLLAFALEADACMIVCGSRVSELGARPRPRSISTELVSRSRWPVAVVPPDEQHRGEGRVRPVVDGQLGGRTLP